MALGAFNQVFWPGVGDVDECWIIATYWALVATGVMRREDLPSIRKFRALAGRPDRPGSSGGNNSNIMTALRALKLPGLDAVKYDGGRAGFERMLKKGYVASLSVRSWSLPKAYQFGYRGNHQISVIWKNGKFYIMNPLQQEGAALMEINPNNLVFAANGLLGDRLIHAVFIKSKAITKRITKSVQVHRQPRSLLHVMPETDYIEPYSTRDWYHERGHYGDVVEGERFVLPDPQTEA